MLNEMIHQIHHRHILNLEKILFHIRVKIRFKNKYFDEHKHQVMLKNKNAREYI